MIVHATTHVGLVVGGKLEAFSLGTATGIFPAHAMGPNSARVIGSAVAYEVLLAIFG